jgi:hypothetical protein
MRSSWVDCIPLQDLLDDYEGSWHLIELTDKGKGGDLADSSGRKMPRFFWSKAHFWSRATTRLIPHS